MGEFVRVYGYESEFPEGELIEENARHLVIADAVNQGYTPDGDVAFMLDKAARKVKATLPVVERTS